MKPPVAVAGGAALWLVLAWLLPPLAKLPPGKTLALRLILATAGVLIAAAILWYRKQKDQPPSTAAPASPQAATSQSPLETLLREADVKLAASALGRSARLSRLPVILLMGPPGSAKTTAVLQSRLEPELLAGQVNQDSTVVPTQTANAWFARNAVFLEIASALQADLKTWPAIARRIQPGKWESAFGRAQAAPRAVVVCYEAESLLKANAAETAAEAAKAIRTQLFELSARLGSNLPVYVLFTKLDRVAFFLDFVRSFDDNEAAQILGATLSVEKTETGVYAERQSARLANAFAEIAVSLAAHRTELLTRESDPEIVLSAYEFPREFRKLRNAGVRFLLELCRPGLVNTAPFLRGFFFGGVRPVLITEEIAAEPARFRETRAAQPFNPDATSIFLQRSAVDAPSHPVINQPVRRRVPQWLSQPGFFRDVLLADRSGLAASAFSTRINFARRLLLGSFCAVALLLALVTLSSYLKNRALIERVRDASGAVSADKSAGAAGVSPESLRRLDTLRQSLVELTGYEEPGRPPLSLRWGLYSGSQILPPARRLYFDRFRSLLLGNLTAGFVQSMRSWPAAPAPDADYSFAYDTLKAYLETTSHHEKATLAYLPPLLEKRWVNGQPVDPAKIELARRQFDFYTAELIRENPYSAAPDSSVVAKARDYLARFTGVKRIYENLLNQANQTSKPLVFNRLFPGSAEIVWNAVEVPGAFTKPGFASIENALKDPARYGSGETWVLGERQAVAGDTGNLAEQINALYFHDYIEAWRDYLRKSRVQTYKTLADAVNKLAKTASNSSPLLALFSLASQNTDVNAPAVQQAFKPLHALMPPATPDQYIGSSNNAYMTALTSLQNTLDQASKLPPEQIQAAADQTTAAANSAKLAAQQTALPLGVDPEAHIEAIIQKLLTDPITNVDAVKPNGASPAPLNAAGAAFCAGYRALMSKYPFNPAATAKASIEDVNAVFRPQSGLLWQFYEQKLNKLLTKQGATYAPVLGQKPEPTAHFVAFFNNAVRFGNALYANGASQDPKLTFALQPAFSQDLQSVAISIDGESATLQQNSPAQHFVWPGSGSGVRMVAKSGSEMTYPTYDGLWGVFDFFFDADKLPPSPEWTLKGGRSGKAVTSPLTNQPVAVHFNLDMLGAPPLFDKAYYRTLACVPEVAK